MSRITIKQSLDARARDIILRNPLHLLSAGFGSGLSPWVPGTFGSAVALLLYLPVHDWPLSWYLGLAAAVTIAGIPLCEYTARALGEHDHRAIVWDEIAGMLITLTAAPPGWWWVLAGFVLFRAFDIVKPWPIRLIDARIGGGFGIMLDDVLAGVYAWAALQLAALGLRAAGF